MKTYVVKANNCFKEDSLVSNTRKRVCTTFPLTVKFSSSVVLLWVFTEIFRFFPAKFWTFFEKIGSLSSFSFQMSVMFLTTKTLANQVSNQKYNTTHCSLVRFRKLYLNFFFEKYYKLKKATGVFKKPTSEKKSHSFRPRNLEIVSFFGTDLEFRCFTLLVFVLNIRYHPFNKVEEWFCNSSFFLKRIC